MAKIKIKQIKSAIDRPKRQKLTLEALGIRKMNGSAVHDDNPVIRGMIDKVKHLLEIEEVK
jgi:large subunit ribosomal protein L30